MTGQRFSNLLRGYHPIAFISSSAEHPPSADRQSCGLRLFVDQGCSMARDDPRHGKDADRKMGRPRDLLLKVDI